MLPDAAVTAPFNVAVVEDTPLPFMPVHQAPSPNMTVWRSTRRMALPGAGDENGDVLYEDASAEYCWP